MPGFGTGPFGSDPFGQFNWSKEVFYNFLPSIYRQEDEETEEKYFKRFVDSYSGLFDYIRAQIANFTDLRDPLRVSGSTTEQYELVLGTARKFRRELSRQGFDGSVDSSGVFISARAKFFSDAVGTDLRILNSTVNENAQFVEIVEVVSVSSIRTSPALTQETGPLKWQTYNRILLEEGDLLVEVLSGDVSKLHPGCTLFDGQVGITINERRAFPIGDARIGAPLSEQGGTDGSINSQLEFMSPTLVVSPTDIGKRISIYGSQYKENTGIFEIAGVSYSGGMWRVALWDPSIREAASLIEEISGSLDWALRDFPELVIPANPGIRGIVEQRGVKADGISGTEMLVHDGLFDTNDAGNLIVIKGSSSVPSNDGVYEITGILSSFSIEVAPDIPTPAETDMFWELRTPSFREDTTTVLAHRPDNLTYLLGDFGLERDVREAEHRKRLLLENLPVWLGLKGFGDGYALLGGLAGFDITAEGLFSISLPMYEYILAEAGAEAVVLVGVGGGEHIGTEGSLELDGGDYIFSDPSANYPVWLEGTFLQITVAGDSANETKYIIEEVLSSTSLRVSFLGTIGAVPDPSNGSIEWAVVRAYTVQEPRRPYFDEINADIMEEVVNGNINHPDYGVKTFGIDRFCWEGSFTTRIPLTMSQAPVALEANLYEVYVEAHTTYAAPFTDAPEAISSVGNWVFVEPSPISPPVGWESESFFVDTVPEIHSGNVYKFIIKSTRAPEYNPSGYAYFEYQCQLVMSCSYCPTNSIKLSVVYGDILEDTEGSLESALDRILTRVEEEISPVHVSLIIQYGINAEIDVTETALVYATPWANI